MICRLCLFDLNNYVSIFDESNNQIESTISKIITKYLHMELQVEDALSNKICDVCWKHLDEFHKFCLLIEEKQKTLEKEFKVVNSDFFENKVILETSHGQGEDIKDVPLYEQPIDTVTHSQSELKDEFAAASGDDGISENEDIEPAEDEISIDSETELSSKQRNSKYSTTKKRLNHRARDLKNVNKTRCKINPSIRSKTGLMERKRNTTTACQTKQHKTKIVTDLKCEICDKVLANIVSLKKHMYRCHPAEESLNYSCGLCEKKFAKKYLLDDHILWHRKVKNKNTCEMCKQGFYSKRELKVHKKSEHANELKIICDSCGRSFKCKLGYENHYKAEHLGITRPEEQCTICGKWLKDDRSLYKHMYKHRDESSGKDFICNICGVVKPTKQTLTAHKSYHHPDKMHKCTLCNKEFKRLLALEEHLAVHSGQPLYSCCFCPQTFKSHANMHTHKKRLHPHEWIPKNSQPRKVVASNETGTARTHDDSKEIAQGL